MTTIRKRIVKSREKIKKDKPKRDKENFFDNKNEENKQKRDK